ncbi:MAG: lysophospholipase [Variovorax sp.]
MVEGRAAIADPQRTELRTADSESLALVDWSLPGSTQAETPARAQVLMVHGLGEHSGRYAHVAARLCQRGFAVRGYDHHGHGRSSGGRGGITGPMHLVDDLARVVDATRALVPDIPVILLGHSLGGLVCASLVAHRMADAVHTVDALVLLSPLLGTELSGLQRLLLAVVPRLAPDLRVGNGVDVAFLSHDTAVVQAYRQDPLIHDRISGRLARFITDQTAFVQAAAPRWNLPTLVLYAGDDRIVSPTATRAFAVAVPGDVATAICFDTLYHEIFNELDAEPVFAHLIDWLDAHF